ncbi:MAG: TPR end-of-group domain-containing protein [Planctomycetota bacterium]
MRNTAPQKASSHVNENRPIYYPRLAHVGAGGQSASAADRLLHELVDLHTAMSYEEAADVADRLVRLTPRRPQAHYNRACVMGRLRRGDEALSSLEQAVNCGWRDLVHLSVDPDLDSIRDTARYADLTRRLQQLISGETAAPPTQPGSADEIRREAPPILHDLGVQEATIAVVNGERVGWTASITTGGAEPQARGRDEPVEVSSVVRLLALMALLKQEPAAGLLAERGHGPVLRQTSHGSGERQAEDDVGLIAAAESATRRPFATYCRTRILGPLRMRHTRFAESSGASGPVVYSTAGDLGRLLAALCAPPASGVSPFLSEAAADRLLAVGERFGLERTIDRGSSAVGLELAHCSRESAALLRWYPQHGRGVVVVTRGGDGIPAARRIAGLALGQ